SASSVFQVQCTSIQEFNEGGFYKVYILKMENGKEYIRRVAFPVYPQWKTKSEIAVIEYIHLYTNIPVPKVYYWNSSVNNPVGAEYILMEHLPGIRLCNIWSDLTMEKKVFLLKIINILLELNKHMFSKIGSIFFDNKNDKFKIGQVIETIIQNQIRYYSTFVSKEKQICWITKYEELCKLVPKYFQDDENNTFVLTHGDFHSSNILVNNDEITEIIDWECSGAFPIECLCTYLVWITNSPVIEPTNKESIEHIILQNFFHAKMSHRNPNFICTIDNIDEEKKEFYSAVFSYEVWKDEFFDKYNF
ncbi:8315_t:CDS:2, partial [Gigaspora margarita]